MYKYIVAMSFDREKVRDKIISSSENIVEHLVKLLYYPSSSDYNHWKVKLFSFLNRVPKLRTSNKWPSKRFIISALSGYNDSIDTFTHPIINDYGNPESNISDKDVLNAIEEYQAFLANMLSKQGYVLNTEIYRKIDEIVAKYSK